MYQRSLSAVFTLLLAASLGFLVWAEDVPAERLDAGHAAYVGSQACTACHKPEHEAWAVSQHAVAMQDATPETVLGHFDGSTFAKDGVTTTFFRKDGKFLVRTDGPTGKLDDFEVRYVFGVYPLQQYLIAFPQGRYQALGIAWDSRPAGEGGQRWYDLYPDRSLKPGSPLHWTGLDQNWNYQCAFCHSTNLQKNYDPQTKSFKTSWSEINVGCEACHGPASQHVAWASGTRDASSDPAKGFATRLDERAAASWIMGKDGQAARTLPRTSTKEIETCAACHARRGQFSDDRTPDIHDSFRPAGIETGLYHSDGQQLDEVYTYGSFLQSRMFAAGVTCSDCHDPHSGKLRRSGNSVCTECHAASRFDVTAHHHHAEGSPGSQCVSCHMPTTTYMGVDARHDHSMRIPRPDRTAALGTPNACAACHKDKTAASLAASIKSWTPDPKPGFQSFAEAFHLGDRMAPGAAPALEAVVTDPGLPSIVKSSALQRLGQLPSRRTLQLAQESLAIDDAPVQTAAIAIIADAGEGARAALLPPLLRSPKRLVRMDAARALVGAELKSSDDRKAFDAALAEYVAGQLFNAERPEAQANLGNLYRQMGQRTEARAALQTALDLDKTFVPAAISLSEMEAEDRGDAAGEKILRESLVANPHSGALLHAIGLTLVRQKQTQAAIGFLQRAAEAEPNVTRYSYVLAVALHDTGDAAGAIATLKKALTAAPYNRDLLLALANYEAEAGERESAIARVELLRKLEPDWAGLGPMLQKLRGG